MAAFEHPGFLNMQIFVKTLGATLTLDVDQATTVEQVTCMVEDAEFIPAHLQRLTCGTSVLCGASTLGACGIAEADTLVMNLPVLGGMR